MRSARLLALAALVSIGSSASAHSPMPGMGLFYSGMLHPVLVPAHLMAIIAMGLWLGQRWPADGSAMAAVLLAVPVGMTTGAMTGWQQADIVVLGVTAVVAVAVASAGRGPVVLRVGVGVLLGTLLGIDSLPDGLSGRTLWLSLGGTWFAFLLGLSWMVAISEFAARPWMKIGLRVVASWLAAAAVLVLALSVWGPQAKPSASAVSAPASAAR